MMNTDKAYLLGIVVGGGHFSTNKREFHIELPYRLWGDVAKNPERAGQIAKDIVKVLAPLFSSEYGLNIAYTTGRDWRIECYGDTKKLVEDVERYGLNAQAEVKKNANISKIVSALVDTNLKRRFIAGLADTIGSMAPSHRRFSDDVQIISFEIKGFSFTFICQLCSLLSDVGVYPDQILWQHPNIQSGNNTYYKQWRKGNKLRVTLDSFTKYGSLAFRSKAAASRENLERQSGTNEAVPCEKTVVKAKGITCLHIDENCSDLPPEIRGGHFIHHKQICAALGCPHAPYAQVKALLAEAAKHVSPFTTLTKGEAADINNIVNHDPLLKARKYTAVSVPVKSIVDAFDAGKKTMYFVGNAYGFSDVDDEGYPMNYIMEAVGYILAGENNMLNGTRVQGARDDLFNMCLHKNPGQAVKFYAPDLLTPVQVSDGKYSALVGPLNTEVYRKLISFAPENPYKMILRPITEADLKE